MRTTGEVSAPRAWRPAITIVLLTGIGNLLALLYQIIVGRTLGPGAYSLFSSIFVVIGVIGVASSGLQVAVTQAIAAGRATEERTFADPFTRQGLALGCALGAALLVATPVFTAIFRIGWQPFLIVAFCVPVAVLLAVVNGRFQGRGLILAMMSFSTVLAAAKLLSTLPVMAAGLGTTSFLAGFLVVSLVMGVLGLVLTRGAGAVRGSALSPDVVRGVTTMTLFWFLSNLDIVAARALLDEADAGQWAAASVLAKSALILPGVVALAVLPAAVRARREGRPADLLARRALVLALAAAALPASLLVPLGDLVVRLLYGPAFDPAGDLAWRIALGVIPLALAQVLIQFHLARERGKHVLVLVAVAVGLPVALWAAPRTTEAFALALAGASAVTFIGLVPPRKWRLLRRLDLPADVAAPAVPASAASTAPGRDPSAQAGDRA